MSPANVVGGSNAFFSGRTTELTPSAKRKIVSINQRIEKLSERFGDDE